MNLLQDIFQKQLAQIVPELAAQAVSRKMSEHGISLSQSDKRRLVAHISQSKLGTFRFQKWKFWDRRSIKVDLTEQEIKNIEDKSSAIIDKLPSLVESIAEEITNHMADVLKERWPSQQRPQQQTIRTFEANLALRWKKPLDLISMILTIGSELGSNLNVELRKEGTGGFLVDVLTRLHARACQVAGEVICLLSSGYADGAMARWRTLHEIAVVALFIQAQGEECAERYVRHSLVDSYRAALNYQKYRERLGEPPLEQKELAALKQSYDDLQNRFGTDYREQYGWAAAALGNPNPKFADIERAVGIDHLRPYYKMASYNVHANPKGVFFKLGLIHETQLLLAGPSNFGLADPGQNAALSLCHVSSALIVLHPTLDAIVTVKVMLSLASEAAESFVAVQHAIEQEEIEKPIRANGI